MQKNTSRLVVSWIITAAASLLLILHFVMPTRSLDSISLFLFAFAVVPWLGRVFTKLELPGGLKFEYQSFEDAAKEASDAGLLDVVLASLNETEISPPIYQTVLESDPNLALAGLRIDIEQRLRQLAVSRDLPVSNASLGAILRRLQFHEVLTVPQVSALRDIVSSLNGAAHGETISLDQARSVMQIGRQLIASLDSFRRPDSPD
jgi:hypothetical protein